MDWTTEDCIKLISLYELAEMLWDPKNASYYSKNLKHDAWCSIAKELHKPIDEVKKKMLSLQGSFRREKAKVKRSFGTGKGANEIYKSKWFAYDAMHFLSDRDDPRPTINSENTLNEAREMYLPNIENETDSTDTFYEIVVPNDESETQELNETFLHEQECRLENIEFICPSPIQPPRGKKRNKASLDSRIDEAFNILKKSASSIDFNQQTPDECSTYGTHVGNKLRNYTSKTRSIVQHYINNLLFEADMGKFDNYNPQTLNSTNMHPSFLPTCHQNPSQTSPHVVYQGSPQSSSSSSIVDINQTQ